MNAFSALLLGLVEGVTEFLPVSSTGHLILTSNALGLENSEFLKLFEIVIQTGAILAVISIYFQDLLKDWSYLKNITIAFLPTAFLGLLFHGIIKKYLFTPQIVCGALFGGGIALLFFEQLTNKFPNKKLGTKDYLFLGLFQCLAFIPGVSRSAATILGARFLGATREEAVKFSFLLAIPTILSASAYSLLKVNTPLNQEHFLLLLIGCVSSYVFGYLSVKIFLKWLNKQTFIICGVYRIIFAILYFTIFI
jgi:undecaprenyl-diphosphatase